MLAQAMKFQVTIKIIFWLSEITKPYTSKEGREEHDFIVNQITKIIHNL